MVHHNQVFQNLKFEAVESIVPPDATHCLRCGYRNFVGYSQETIKQKVKTIVVPVVNTVLSPIGWQYIDAECYGNYFEIYYKEACPVEPVTTATVISILQLIVIAIIGICVTFVAWVFLEVKKMEAQAKIDKKKLLEEKKITSEQYVDLIGSQKEEDMWGSLKWILILVLFIVILGAVAPALPKRKD